MPSLRVRTATSVTQRVTVRDMGIAIEPLGGFVDLLSLEECRSASESSDLDALLASGTLIMVDLSAMVDVPYPTCLSLLRTAALPSSGPYSILMRDRFGDSPAAGALPSGYHYFSDDDEDASTSATYSYKINQSTPSLAAGTYLVMFHWQPRGSQSGTVIGVRVTANGESQEYSTGPNNSAQPPFVTFAQVILANPEPIPVSVEIRRTSGGGTAFVSKARVALWRVA